MSRKIIRLYFFGDSICFGQGVSPHRVWVTRLAYALQAKFEDRCELIVQNPSVNGNTTRMALERMAYDVQTHEPHVLYTQFGMNDCNGWETDRGHPRVSTSAFAANLAEIVDRGRMFGAREVVLGTNHPTTRTDVSLPYVDHTYDGANRSYNAITRRVAAEKRTLLADAEADFDAAIKMGRYSYSDLVLSDRLHLSEQGHDIYFESRMPVLVQAIESVISTLDAANKFGFEQQI
jgi:lysophospholipase L1-like esterase